MSKFFFSSKIMNTLGQELGTGRLYYQEIHYYYFFNFANSYYTGQIFALFILCKENFKIFAIASKEENFQKIVIFRAKFPKNGEFQGIFFFAFFASFSLQRIFLAKISLFAKNSLFVNQYNSYHIAVFFVPSCGIGGVVEHKNGVEDVKAVEFVVVFVDYAAVARAISRRAENVYHQAIVVEAVAYTVHWSNF